MFYKNLTSQEFQKKYKNNRHLAIFVKETEGALEDFTVNEIGNYRLSKTNASIKIIFNQFK
jgi:hypothetical protein